MTGITKENLAKQIKKTDIPFKLKHMSKPYNLLIKEFDENEKELSFRFQEFAKKAGKPEDWKKEENIAEFNAIFHDAAFNFPLLLLAMQDAIRDENNSEPTKGLLNSPDQRTQRIVTQGYADHPYDMYFKNDASKTILNSDEYSKLYKEEYERQKQTGVKPKMKEFFNQYRRENIYAISKDKIFPFRLCYSTLISMYHYARSKSDVNALCGSFNYDKAFPHSFAKEFYDKQNKPTEYQWRQAYNKNMKLFHAVIDPDKTGHSWFDERVERWTRVDTSKNETSFKLYPDTRPTP